MHSIKTTQCWTERVAQLTVDSSLIPDTAHEPTDDTDKT